jgi:hypothetical protein
VSFQVKAILAFVVIILLALGAMLLFRSSDEKDIEKILEKGLAAAEAGDAEGVVALISQDYKNGDETREMVVRKIRQAVNQRISPAKLDGAVIQVSGDAADANLQIVIGALQLRRAFGLHLKLKREGSTWRVTSADPVEH